MSKLNTIGELFSFFWKRKLWWLMPLIAVLILVGLLAVFIQTSALAPILYPLF